MKNKYYFVNCEYIGTSLESDGSSFINKQSVAVLLSTHPLDWVKERNRRNHDYKTKTSVYRYFVKVLSWQEVSKEEYNKFYGDFPANL